MFAESAHKTIQENSYFYTRTDVILIPRLCEYILVAMQQRIYCFSEKQMVYARYFDACVNLLFVATYFMGHETL